MSKYRTRSKITEDKTPGAPKTTTRMPNNYEKDK